MYHEMGVVGKGQLAGACLLLLQGVSQKSNLGCRSPQGEKKKKEKERPLLAEHLEASTLFCHRKGFSMSLGLVCACWRQHWGSKRTCPWWLYMWLLAQFLKILKIYLHIYVCMYKCIHSCVCVRIRDKFQESDFCQPIDAKSLPSPPIVLQECWDDRCVQHYIQCHYEGSSGWIQVFLRLVLEMLLAADPLHCPLQGIKY